MKFIRLTSVFLCCALLSSFLILPVSAVDDDDYYSTPAVSDGSALVAPVSLGGIALASATSWDTTDRSTLQGIYKFIQYITTAPSSYSNGSIIGLLHQILDSSIPNAGTNFRLIGSKGTNDFLKDLFDKTTNFYNYVSGENIAGNLGDIQRNTLASASRLLDSNSYLSSIFGKVATEETLSAFKTLFSANNIGCGDNYHNFIKAFGMFFGYETGNTGAYYYPIWRGTDASDRVLRYDSWASVVGNLYSNLTSLYNPNMTDGHTFLWYVSMLQDVLASEDDKKLADSQKENREQIEKDFVSGSSGKTSLGKDDFGSLSSVGGTFKDTISLNGQSSLGDLTSGLSDADTVGQGWFSQATKDSLDAVSGSSSESTVSTFSDDGLTSVDVDPDPYHMQGFEDNYAWLWGDDDG